ncbi:hypothetical protein R1flu_004471 [Riccia fluitans]|uniref:Uncharacterized protein n=1 Tax=Riccia fluitans TaxID=41844 RepID=A0ABD1YUE1_9MARC
MRSTHSAARAKKLKVMAIPSIEVQEPQLGCQRKGKSSIGAVGGLSCHRMNQDEYELIIGYVASFRKAKEWSKSTNAGLTEEELERGMTIEGKLNKKCPFYFRMHALFGHHANIEPPVLADGGLSNNEDLSEEQYEDDLIADRDGDEVEIHPPVEDDIHMDADTQPSVNPQISKMKELIAASQPYVVIGKVASGRTRSSLQHPEEDNNNRTGRNEEKGPSGHKSNLIHVYEESVQEKTQYRKAALDAKESFREAMLTEMRMARA